MPNFTTPYPQRLGDIERDYEKLFDWAISLIDELKFVLSNLDEYNISEDYKNYLMTLMTNDE